MTDQAIVLPMAAISYPGNSSPPLSGPHAPAQLAAAIVRHAWRTNIRITIAILIFAAANATADTKVHRCSLEDGTIAFQEIPCAEPAEDANEGSESGESQDAGNDKETAAEDDAFDFVNPFDEPESPPASTQPIRSEPVSQDRAECEKMTRDAIDSIDLEMRNTAYTKEQGQDYLAELLQLTRQLRDCRQL
jgi:hypothetical protein